MKLASLAIALCALSATPVWAQFQKPEDAVKYRQSALTLMGNHLSRIGAMVNNRVPFDAAQAAANAELVATLSTLPFAGFIEGTAAGTKAKPSIWTERAKFDETAKKMQEEAAKLVTAAKGGNLEQLKAAFGATAQSCKACHDNYRN